MAGNEDCLIWRSVSEYRFFATAVGRYSFGNCFCPSLVLFNAMSFFRTKIPSEMLLQVVTETSDILSFHRWIWY